MVRAHPFATAGGGTLFEYKVACLFACDVLCARHTALGGLVTSVRTQTGPEGFDDLQLTLELPDGSDVTAHTQCRHRQPLTVSNAKFKDLLVSAHTAVAADREAFASRRSRLVLVVDESSPGHASMTTLCKLAGVSSTVTAFQAAVTAQGGAVAKRLGHCRRTSELDIAELHSVLAALDVLALALDDSSDRDSVEFINRLSGLWDPADAAAALDLGRALFSHVCDLGPRAGGFDLRSLQDDLRASLPATIGATSRRARLGRLKNAGKAKIATRLRLLGLDDAEAAALAVQALGEPPIAITDDLVVLIGTMGVGKTTELERQHQRAIDDALADTNSPIPVFVHARQLGTSSVESLVTAETEGLGDASKVGVHLIIDGLDEAGLSISDIVEQTASVAARWPNSKIVVATRPQSATPKIPMVLVEALSVESTERLMTAIYDESSTWLPSRDELTEVLRRPLFAIRYALDRREGNFVATHPANLVASVGRHALEDLDPTDHEAFGVLTRLACAIVDSGGQTIDLSALAANPLQLELLTRTRILEVGGGRATFQLAVLTEWFAATEILSKPGRLEACLSTPLAAHRWRYALAQAILQGSDEDVDRIMATMLSTRPGIAAWVFDEAQAPSGLRRKTPLPGTAIDAGNRIRHAARYWLDPWPTLQASYTFDGMMPVLGVAVESVPVGSTNPWVITAWGTERPQGEFVVPLPDHIHPLADRDAAWTDAKAGRPREGPLWSWDWTRDRYQRFIDDRLEGRELIAGVSVCWPELAWDYAHRMLRKSPAVQSAPVSIHALEAAIARIAEAVPDADEVFVGGGRYGWHLSEGRAFVEDLRRLGINQIEPPWPAADSEGDWISHWWTTDQLLARLHLSTKAALDVYTELVEKATPAMAPELATYQLLPARVVGRVTPGDPSLGMRGGPGFRWYIEPLPAGSDNDAVWTIAQPHSGTDEPWEEMAALIRQRRGEFATVKGVTIHYGEAQVFSSTPAGSLALSFFANDLAELKWTTQSGRIDINSGSVRPIGR